MDLEFILILGTVFIFTASLVGLIYLIWTESKFAEKRTVKKRLLHISAGGSHGKEVLSKYKEKALKEAGFFQKMLFSLPRVKELDRLLINAGVPLNTSAFVLICFTLGASGMILGSFLLPQITLAIALGVILFILPFLFLRIMESRNMARFEEQLPEALDLLARAVRSGHALSSGMEMVSEEMGPPIGREFETTIDEMNMGLSLKEALDNMTERVPSQDLRFFAVSVIIQKETGGNIAEIFDNLSRLIRERLQFRRQVKALTAEGRLSGLVLVVLPFLVFFIIYITNTEYVRLLWTDPVGIYMSVGAMIMMVIGMFFIKRIVSIEI
ncbi:MAG TPA: type II secretion system F family protein [Desulfuromonadales bacterium]|nr:type II secretion system F family protein [Desulfuromonadales bacterium]